MFRKLLVMLLLVAGCGPPQVGQGNHRLIQSLRTAISARRADWLEQTARMAQRRRDAGQLEDEPYAALEGIIEQARGGDWEGAEEEVVRLANAQRGSD